jgi:hypothetical protein
LNGVVDDFLGAELRVGCVGHDLLQRHHDQFVRRAAFSDYDGCYGFQGITSLSVAAAQALSKSMYFLDLSGLATVSDAAAEVLSKCKGQIQLRGLTSLTHAGLAAKITENDKEVDLPALTELSDEAADAIFKTKAKLLINANKLKSLNHLGLARKLAIDSGESDLVAVTSLSASDAAGLHTHEGNLNFTRLTTLTVPFQ